MLKTTCYHGIHTSFINGVTGMLDRILHGLVKRGTPVTFISASRAGLYRVQIIDDFRLCSNSTVFQIEIYISLCISE
jgi:hypothetical protein